MKKRLSVGCNHILGLCNDGTVVATGGNVDGQCNVGTWKDIVSISAGDFHSLGLKSDGRVVAVGNNENEQCEVSSWNDIVAVAAGKWHSLGLNSNGTVVASGINDKGECDVGNWSDIVAIAAGDNFSLGLKSNGTVIVSGDIEGNYLDFSCWENIMAISSHDSTAMGLKEDGTVVVTGYEAPVEVVSSWKDIVAIDGSEVCLGLRKDGTVAVVGEYLFGKCNIDEWEDVVEIVTCQSVSAALKSDGTVLIDGYVNDFDVSFWSFGENNINTTYQETSICDLAHLKDKKFIVTIRTEESKKSDTTVPSIDLQHGVKSFDDYSEAKKYMRYAIANGPSIKFELEENVCQFLEKLVSDPEFIPLVTDFIPFCNKKYKNAECIFEPEKLKIVEVDSFDNNYVATNVHSLSHPTNQYFYYKNSFEDWLSNTTTINTFEVILTAID